MQCEDAEIRRRYFGGTRARGGLLVQADSSMTLAALIRERDALAASVSRIVPVSRAILPGIGLGDGRRQNQSPFSIINGSTWNRQRVTLGRIIDTA